MEGLVLFSQQTLILDGFHAKIKFAGFPMTSPQAVAIWEA